jgi:RNA polymerase sigma-70 factor (ECF subfamily)
MRNIPIFKSLWLSPCETVLMPAFLVEGLDVAVLERYYRELLNYFSRHLKDRDGAADVVQEAYARVLTVQQAGQAIREPRALLYRTARNIVIDQQRHLAVSERDGPEVLDEIPAPSAEQPEQVYAAHQRAQQLVEVIDALPPRCREAFVLHKFEGLSHAEVAERMGISRNMVERHVMLAVLACRKHRDGDASEASGQGGKPC